VTKIQRSTKLAAINHVGHGHHRLCRLIARTFRLVVAVYTMVSHRIIDSRLTLVPLVPPLILLILLLDNPIPIISRWIQHYFSDRPRDSSPEAPPVGSQLLAYVTVACLGYLGTNRLVPHIKQYTLRKGISGRDLGKLGTSIADKDM
jgi:hypothetical protein